MSGRLLVVLGCGYIGSRVARAALAAGRPVRVAARNTQRLAPLAELGAEVHRIDAAKPKQFSPVLVGASGATVLYSIPPFPDLPPGEAVRRATQASLGAGVGHFIHLTSAGVYGMMPDDDWVDENHSIAFDDGAMGGFRSDEQATQAADSAGLRTVILRLAAVYGGGRGVRTRLRKGDYKLVDEGEHWVSRIHIDDLVRIIFAAEARAPVSSMYLVADDRPTPQREVADHLVARLPGLQPPTKEPAYAPGRPRVSHRGRRITNARLKKDLGLTLLYPSYVEGEAQIDAEEGGAAPWVPPPGLAQPPGSAPLPAAPVVAAAPQRPACISRLLDLRPGPLGALGLDGRIVGLDDRQLHTAGRGETLALVVAGTPHLLLEGTRHNLAPGDLVFLAPPGALEGEGRFLLLRPEEGSSAETGAEPPEAAKKPPRAKKK